MRPCLVVLGLQPPTRPRPAPALVTSSGFRCGHHHPQHQPVGCQHDSKGVVSAPTCRAVLVRSPLQAGPVTAGWQLAGLQTECKNVSLPVCSHINSKIMGRLTSNWGINRNHKPNLPGHPPCSRLRKCENFVKLRQIAFFLNFCFFSVSLIW